MEYWLKTIGASRAPLPDDWLKVSHRLSERVHFPKNARPRGISQGDHFLLYGVTDIGGRIIGAARFESPTFYLDDGSQEPERRPEDVESWPWRLDITILLSVWHSHRGPTVDAIGVPGTKVRRRSHIRITEEEYQAGVEALAAVARP